MFFSGELEDDVTPGILQRASRFVDVAAVGVVALALLDEPPDGLEYLLGLLAVRYACPLFDVFSLGDLRARLARPSRKT